MGLFLAVFFPLFALFLHTLSPTVPLEDGGELIRSAWCLGVAHPPGYPLYMMLGRLAMLVPLGDPAFRMNLLSAVCGASACGWLALVASGFTGEPGRKWGRFSAWAGAILLGTGFSVWWQSSIAEKYSLNLLLATLCSVAMLNALRGNTSPARRAVLLCLAFGVWVTHHGQAVYFLPAVGLVLWRVFRESAGARWRIVLSSLLAMALAVSPKLLYTAIRASAHPLHNWNDPEVLGRFAGYSIGNIYQWRSFFWGPLESWYRLVSHLLLLFPHQFDMLGLALGIGGMIIAVRRMRAISMPWILGMAGGIVFCASFYLEGIAVETYYLPVFMAFTLFISAGMSACLARLGRYSRYAVVVVALWLAAHAIIMRPQTDRSRHYFAYDFVVNMLSSVPRNAVLIGNSDYDIFPLWYVHDVLGKSPGVIVVDANYLTPWLVSGPTGGRVELIYPPGAGEYADKYPFADDYLESNPGQPVFFSTFFKGIELFPLLPAGAVYRLDRGKGKIPAAGILAERVWFKRWRRLRGVMSKDEGKDEHTQTMLANYLKLDYRAGYVLMEQGRFREAVEMLKLVLGWPPFEGADPAAIHGSIGWCLEKIGDDAGALEEYREALEIAPDRAAIMKLLGDLFMKLGRGDEALATFRRVVSLNPTDDEARHKAAQLQYGLPGK